MATSSTARIAAVMMGLAVLLVWGLVALVSTMCQPGPAIARDLGVAPSAGGVGRTISARRWQHRASPTRNPLKGLVMANALSPKKMWAKRGWRGRTPFPGAAAQLKKICALPPYDDFVHVVARMAAAEGMALHTIIDVGGNLGRYTETVLEAAHATGVPLENVVTFEPNVQLRPQYDTRIGGAVSRLGMQGTNLTFVQAGVGPVDDTLTLHLSDNSELSGFAPGKTKFHSGKTAKVPVVRLDSFFLKNPQLLPIDFLKIDVEGLDMQVIRGAAALLRCETCVGLLQFEFGGAWKDGRSPEKVGLEQVVGTLDMYGYDTFAMSETQLLQVNRGNLAIEAHKCYWTNFLAVRRSHPRRTSLSQFIKVSSN